MMLLPTTRFLPAYLRAARALFPLLGYVLLVQVATAEELFSKKQEQGQIVVAKSDRSFSVTLRGEGDVHATAFVLARPTRLVVDAKGMGGAWNVANSLKDSFVRKIRIGSHPDKIRLVLELGDGSPPKPIVDTADGAVTILFSADKTVAASTKSEARPVKQAIKTATPAVSRAVRKGVQAAEVDESEDEDSEETVIQEVTPPPVVHGTQGQKGGPAVATPIAHSVVVGAGRGEHDHVGHKIVEPTLAPATPVPPTPVPPTPTAVPTRVPTVVPTPTAVVFPTKEVATHSAKESAASKPATTTLGDQKLADTKTDQMLESVHFLKGASKKEAFIELRFTKEPDRGVLQRRDDTTYILTVPNSGLATLGLALPQYPPEGFDGIMFVHAQGGDPELEVTVAIDRGTAVTSSVEGNTLTIKAVAK